MLVHSFLVYFTGIDLKKVKDCVGDPDANVDNPVLNNEQDSQVCVIREYSILLGFFGSLIRPFCWLMNFCFRLVTAIVEMLLYYLLLL